MNTAWSDFLAARGATFSEGHVQHFGNAPAEIAATAEGNILVDLSHLGLLAVTGEDAMTFLQGQFTNDVRLLDGSNSQFSGYCTAKGRLLATMLLWKHAESCYIQLDAGIAPTIAKRLGMFVLRAKVKINDLSAHHASPDHALPSLVRFGIAGHHILAALAGIFPEIAEIPQMPQQLSIHGNTILLRLPGIAPRFEIITTADNAPALWEQLSVHCTPAGTACWEWLDIHAGIPQVTSATQEEFVPQMLNLDLLGGINFKKGCYTGQEIVARTHYLGKVKRRTQLAHLATEQVPQANDDVFGDGTTEPVGKVVNVAAAPGGGFDLLVETRMEALEAGPLHWKTQEGPILEWLALPYSL